MIRVLAPWILITSSCFVGLCEAGERIALVIGNSKYADNAELRNPTRDADAVELALKALDFEVVTLKDLNLEQLDNAIIQFSRKLGKGKVGLFYYAGHGLQVKGENYLVPLGAKLQEESQVKYQCYAVDQILESMAESECSLKMLVLDSCRDNPFKRSWTRGGTASGLAAMSEVPEGTIIAFSTAQGSTAADGSGNNSPFTEQLVRVLGLRDQSLEVTQVIRLTAQALKKQTGQSPWFHQDAAMEPYYLWKINGSVAFSATTAAVPLVSNVTKPPPEPITNSIGMKLTLIPAGEFMMGSPTSELGWENKHHDDESPQHLVRITKAFYLGTYEVTRGQFAQFVAAENYRTEAERDGKGGYGWVVAGNHAHRFQSPTYTWRSPGFSQADDHPVVNVSWNDAVAFCEWLSTKDGKKYSLPTEAQWEYACRAGTTTQFFHGENPEGLTTIGNVTDRTWKSTFVGGTAISGTDGYVFTASVGRFKPNNFGLYDMVGNVFEWCDDWYDPNYYKQSRVDNPGGLTTGTNHVMRGGSWSFDGAFRYRSAYRGKGMTNCDDDRGFRVVSSP